MEYGLSDIPLIMIFSSCTSPIRLTGVPRTQDPIHQPDTISHDMITNWRDSSHFQNDISCKCVHILLMLISYIKVLFR